MAEFKISRFRYTWKGNWTTAINYIKDDVVKYGGSSWVCVRAHTSSAFQSAQTFVPEGSTHASPAWIKMADGYAWRDEWTTATLYNPGDVVSNGGEVYLCVTPHTSASTFVAGATNWVIYTSGISWADDWDNATRYEVGDLVKYNGVVYRCTVEHVSDSVLENLSGDSSLQYWEIYNSGVEYAGPWGITDTRVGSPTFEQVSTYRVNDLVRYGGSLWRCKETHAVGSDSTLNFKNEEFWTIEFPGQQRNSVWSPNTEYQPGDVVSYGGHIYRSLTENYNRVPGNSVYQLLDQQDPADWAILSKGKKLVGTWSPTTVTVSSTTALAGGMTLTVLKGVGELDTNTQILEIISTTQFTLTKRPVIDLDDALVEFVNATSIIQLPLTNSTSTLYKTGDVVRRGGHLYVALIDTTTDGSTLDYLDSSNWELVVPSKNWKNTWAANEAYAIGDIVSFKGSVYLATVEHSSSLNDYPGDNGNGISYWDLLLQGSDNVGTRTRGDLLTYGLSRNLAGDGSSFGLTDVPIDEEDKLLVINDDRSLHYKTWGNTDYLVNVAPNGVDDVFDPDRGFNYFKPWKTIRFATERVEALGLNVGNTVKIRVWPGEYQEVLPIIVPANVAIQGDEVRSVTVTAKKAITALAEDSTYTIAILNRMAGLIEDILDGTPVTKSFGNAKYQFIPEDATALSSRAVGQVIQGLIANIIEYVDFYINSIGEEPTLGGTNYSIINEVPATTVLVDGEYEIRSLGSTDFIALGAGANVVGTTFTAIVDGTDAGTGTVRINSYQEYANAVTLLDANKEFLAAEAIAYMQQTYSTYNFDGESCKRDVRAFIDAWKYDIIYTGNYKSLLAARYYKNAVLGSIREDMFYVRDATGIRNMTLSGLTGTLNPTGVFDYYQRPTGGAYVSLDPGWGPNDDRTWITTRSCYVQNVTTFGYAAIGQKIDGALHNGGNKSIVSNDFTQVISDGIGAWVLNGGRAELVSVFTYYSQVGYLAEDGGIIRATNGNNSYGTFGAVAIGVDSTEIPRTATVNNRNNDAQIASAFAGEVNDEILMLEFDHAGQNYTSANYTFVGSGVNANVVQDEFRDDAVFQVRISNPADSAGIVGGRGYVIQEDNCQFGDDVSITLAASDANEEVDYLGKRIVIVSGGGTGQYGYVTAYDNVSKELSVAKESTGVAGWDHVISGYPIETVLTSDTRYRIEPRLTFTAPDYTATSVSASSIGTWVGVAYGETTETYTLLEGEAGTGTVETQDGLVPIVAVWSVTKNARAYSVTLTNAGAGYADGDTITILGTSLGGLTPENDLYITVTSVSDDSTNSIVGYTYEGTGTSGKFILTPSSGTAASYSIDGVTWENSTMPIAGNWKAVAAGNNKFVAVSYGSSDAASSNNGVDWTLRSMPLSRNWNAVTYGNGTFVAVSGTGNSAAYSTNGTTWAAASMSAGDSTFNEWIDVTYGKNKFVAIASTGNAISYSTDGSSWTAETIDSIADQKDWVGIAYGNNRFVAMSSQGDVAYSFDLATWYDAAMPVRSNGETSPGWTKIRYAQGVFFAVRTNASNTWATSPDGINWTSRTPATTQNWSNLAFGNPDITLEDSTLGNNKPMWIVVSSNSTAVVNKVVTGATTKARAIVEAGQITSIRIWEPGSAYLIPPTLTIVDPSEIIELFTENRIGDGVLGNPSWINRGLGYRTSTTTVTVIGNGFADIIPTGKHLTLNNLEVLAKLGSQLLIDGNTTIYSVVTVTELPDLDSLSAYIQVSPMLEVIDDIQNGTLVSIREKFSQCRITGHDFLDVGTGNYAETNYPTLYSTGIFDAQPFNEVAEEDGGRVFYTSTDQTGNFRTGELFAVEQATGIVTISADFFDLAGLTELRLGGVRLGGTGVVIREFSTDINFTEDSNNVVPTQRAIKAYLSLRLSIGGADLITAAFTAGQIKVGPTGFSNILGGKIRVVVPTNFAGPKAGIAGYMMAQAMFYKSFTQD